MHGEILQKATKETKMGGRGFLRSLRLLLSGVDSVVDALDRTRPFQAVDFDGTPDDRPAQLVCSLE
jgi:hypothetical protein